jgi:hypothetical protein
MKERCVNVKAGAGGVPSGPELVGTAFAYKSAIWRIKGMYFTPTPTGGRELWWILAEQELTSAGAGGGPWE